MSKDEELERITEAYLDPIFGPGAGRKHSAFLRRIESDSLREALHRAHGVEGETALLPLDVHYLVAVCVLCAVKSYGTAAMFAKTLRHLGVPRARIVEAVGRNALWVGAVAATEASIAIQRALDEWDAKGLASLEAWFPEPGTPRG